MHPMASQIRRILATDREVSAIGEALEPEERLSHTSVSERESELLRADGFVATSAFVSRGIHEAAGGDVRVGVAPYGATFPPVALQEQLPRRPPQRGSLSVLYVGQLSYRKGLHWLLAAMRDLEDARGQVTLTVVSRDSPPRWLGRLPSNVTFKSGLTDAEVEIERARHDAFILPSLIEGFGLVYLEALAAGLPIIATENSGAPEIMTHGDNGLLVQPGSKESILEVLDELRSHPETLRDLQHGARTARLRSWSELPDVSAPDRRWDRSGLGAGINGRRHRTVRRKAMGGVPLTLGGESHEHGSRRVHRRRHSARHGAGRQRSLDRLDSMVGNHRAVLARWHGRGNRVFLAGIHDCRRTPGSRLRTTLMWQAAWEWR